jgi:hypothetical protein
MTQKPMLRAEEQFACVAQMARAKNSFKACNDYSAPL